MNSVEVDRKIGNAGITDKIASTLPLSLSLTNFSIEPLIQKPRSGRDISNKRGYITIKGYTARVEDIPKWINKLEGIDFISDVKILSMSRDKMNAKTIFEIEIILK